MATITSGDSPAIIENRKASAGVLQEIAQFWRQFFVAAFDPYRPELHYMRGPGPACAAKRPSSLSH